MNEDAASFESRRRRLFRLAYRMLGCVADAEDIVQEAFLRWARTDRRDIDDPGAFQARIVARLCLDHLKSARVRREKYIGAWLPEPLIEAGPDAAEMADEIGVALMLTLERLSPLERAAFLLHDVFDMDFAMIAQALGRSPVACRRLAARARAHVLEAKPRYAVSPEAGSAMARAFHLASHQGDLGTLRALLADDCVLVSDGGGKRPAALNPILGGERVARFFVGLHTKFAYRADSPIEIVRINGLPGYVTIDHRGVLQTTALEFDGDRVAAIYQMRNPDKLTRVARPP